MRIPESELIINADGSVFHIHMKPEQLADKVVLVGDPGRVGLFETLLDSIECRGASREFVWITGTFNGARITILSTGIGTDNIDIVMTELDALANIDFSTRRVKKKHRTLTVLRIGTSGSIQPEIPLGAYVFADISVSCDGLMNWYENRDSIALADFEEAFKKHVNWDRHLPDPYFVRASQKLIDKFSDSTYRGMTVSASGFYGPQGRVVRQGLAMPNMIADFESFSFGGYKITNFEMESSAVAGMAAKLGHEAGTICCIIAHRYHKAANTNYVPKMVELGRLCLTKLSELQ